MKPRPNVDRVGAYASAICAVHCVLTGAAIGLLSVLGLGFLGSFWAELAFLGVALTVGTVAVVHGHRKHHSLAPAAVFLGGLACLMMSHFLFGHGHGTEERSMGGTIFSVLGGLSLVVFHVLNQRLQANCGCTHCSGETE